MYLCGEEGKVIFFYSILFFISTAQLEEGDDTLKMVVNQFKDLVNFTHKLWLMREILQEVFKDVSSQTEI